MGDLIVILSLIPLNYLRHTLKCAAISTSIYIIGTRSENNLVVQVLSLLPSYEGKSVLELGAGIGRFTGELAKKAGQLIAVDFIDNVIKKVMDLSVVFL